MRQVCRLDELPMQGTFCFELQGKIHFVVRNHSGIYCYLNTCPHRGVPLDWIPNQLLDREKDFIQCASHGALFDIASGRCIYGPCLGKYLEALPCGIRDGWVEV